MKCTKEIRAENKDKKEIKCTQKEVFSAFRSIQNT